MAANPISTTDYYQKWFTETLASVRELRSATEPTDEQIIQTAKDFSLMITPPKGSHPLVFEAAQTSGLLDEINQTCAFFEQYRKELPDGVARKVLAWFSFEPMKESPWSEGVSKFPLMLSQQKFKIKEVGGHQLRASWNDLTTCLCAAASPLEIDRLSIQIAIELKDERSVTLIDFGSGGCLPALPLLSRITHIRQIILYLVDPIYSNAAKRNYMVQKGCIAPQDRGAPILNTPVDLAISELMGVCATHLPEERNLYVYVKQNVSELPTNLRPDKHILFAIDPEPSGAEDFKKAVQYTLVRGGSVYCLNEIAGVNGKLSREEALDTDRIFSRVFAQREEKEPSE